MAHIPERFHAHMQQYHSERSKVGRMIDKYIYHDFFGVGFALSMLNLANKGISWKNKKKGLRLIIKQHERRVAYGRTYGAKILGLEKVLRNTYMPFGKDTEKALREIEGRLQRVAAAKGDQEKLARLDRDNAFKDSYDLTRLSRNELDRIIDLEKQRDEILVGMDTIEFSLTRAAKAYPGSTEQKQHIEDAIKLQRDFAGLINTLTVKMKEEDALYKRFAIEASLIQRSYILPKNISLMQSTGGARGREVLEPV